MRTRSRENAWRALTTAGLVACGLGTAVQAAHAVGPKAEAGSSAKATASAGGTVKTASVPPVMKLKVGKLGDFEDGKLESAGGVAWAAFHFAQSGKQPTGSVSVVDGGQKGKKSLRFEGEVPADAQYGFIGAGCAFGKDGKALVDVTGFKGIRFSVRGDENPYRLSVLSDAVKDYNYHGKSFVAEKEWTTVTVPFTDLKQTEGWGTPVPWTGKDVRTVSFATTYQFSGPAWFEIDNVELYK